MEPSIKDLLEKIETNAVLYFQTGEERFLERVVDSKKRILLQTNVMKINLNEINEIVGDFYTEGDEIKRLPKHLTPIAGELSVIYKISNFAKQQK